MADAAHATHRSVGMPGNEGAASASLWHLLALHELVQGWAHDWHTHVPWDSSRNTHLPCTYPQPQASTGASQLGTGTGTAAHRAARHLLTRPGPRLGCPEALLPTEQANLLKCVIPNLPSTLTVKVPKC